MSKTRGWPSPHGDGSLSWELRDCGVQSPTDGEIITITAMKIAGALSGHLLYATQFTHINLFFSFWLLWVFTVGCGLSCFAVCGILVPPPGIEPTSPALQGTFLTSGPPGKSLILYFFKKGLSPIVSASAGALKSTLSDLYDPLFCMYKLLPCLLSSKAP